MKIFVPAVFSFLCALPQLTHAQLNTGATAPGLVTDVALAGAKFYWNNPTGAAAAGGGVANTATLLSVNTGTTDKLEFKNFGFAIPVGSTINGITVSITQQSSGLSLTLLGITINGSVNDNLVQLVGPGIAANNKATGTAWPSGAMTTNAYGSSSDTWGNPALTAAQVNDPTFGVDVSAMINGGVLLGVNLVPGAAIDNVTMNITYSLPTTLALLLSQWSVTREGSVNQLSWQAANPTAGQYIVEKSANGRVWSDIATVDVVAGKSQERYNYTDKEPYLSDPTYYRLRLHTAGQPDSWSAVQVLSAQSTHPVINMYPNPFHDIINVSAPAPFTRITLRSTQGAALWTKEFPGGGINSTQIPAKSLPQGLYYLTIDGATYTVMKGL